LISNKWDSRHANLRRVSLSCRKRVHLTLFVWLFNINLSRIVGILLILIIPAGHISPLSADDLMPFISPHLDLE